jgi:lysophospholipase
MTLRRAVDTASKIRRITIRGKKRMWAMKTIWAFALGAFMISTQAMAISEQNYAQDMATEVMPFYATGIHGSFAGKDGVPISTIKFENPNEIGAIIIVNGRAETYDLYAEPIYDLAQAGYSIYTYDHRGQGYSGRLLADPQKGHVEHFDDYVDDLTTFIRTVVDSKPHAKRYILGHSMGGAIATLYGLRNPKAIDAYALSSPMFGFNTAPYSNIIAQLIVFSNILVGRADDFAKGQGPYNTAETFATNVLTTSQLRWDTRHAVIIDHPVVQVGGPTNRWVNEALDACAGLIAEAKNFTPPAIVFQAGNDQVAIEAREAQFCSAAQHCTLGATYPKGKHELIREQDYIRTDLYQRAIKFFSEN